MPLVAKETGYPIESATAAAATVEQSTAETKTAPATQGRVLKSSETHPSLKDRSIINQAAWKVAGFIGLANYASSPEQLYELVEKTQKKIEAQMLSVYSE